MGRWRFELGPCLPKAPVWEMEELPYLASVGFLLSLAELGELELEDSQYKTPSLIFDGHLLDLKCCQ